MMKCNFLMRCDELKGERGDNVIAGELWWIFCVNFWAWLYDWMIDDLNVQWNDDWLWFDDADREGVSILSVRCVKTI